MIIKIYKFFDDIFITRILMDLVAWIKVKLISKKINPIILKNIEWINEMDIPYEWFIEKKKKWISWIARLKNAEHFLELVIESHINYLDEIILVDNKSTDNTKNICNKMVLKYPDKIKFYEYNYEVVCYWNNFIPKINSIHSLWYYYNWCFSKSKYKYVMKLDDDNLLIPDVWEKIREYIINKEPNRYIAYWWYNLLSKNWKIWICENNLYSGKLGDHWICPVSEYTFHTQWKECEIFNHNYFFKRFFLAFFHLKYLKNNDYWLHNMISTNIWLEHKNNILDSKIIDLNKILNNKNIIYINKKLNKYR